MEWGPGRILAVSVAVLLAVHVGSCSYISEAGQRNFKNVRVGDSLDHVVLRMGRPSTIQEQGAEAPNGYGGTDCHAPCKKRVWYLNRGSLVGEAWSFEMDEESKVQHAAYWMSP